MITNPADRAARRVWTIYDLGASFGCCHDTICATLRTRPWTLPPEMPRTTKAYRWSRNVVLEWIRTTNSRGTKLRLRGVNYYCRSH